MRFRRARAGPFTGAVLACCSTPDDVDPARLAHHAEEAADTEAILRFAPEAAARAAAVGSHREAADQYALALRHAGEVEPAQRADWLVLRALSCYVTDQNDETLESLRLAASIYHELGDERLRGTRT